MGKSALTQTQYADLVVERLIEAGDYEADDCGRSDVIKILKAAAATTIENADRENGCIVLGIGKLRLHKKPAMKARMGRNPSTGEEMKLKAKPSQYVPKFRLSKAAKDGAAELVEDKNRKLRRAFKK